MLVFFKSDEVVTQLSLFNTTLAIHIRAEIKGQI
jgi:hypothetical protein